MSIFTVLVFAAAAAAIDPIDPIADGCPIDCRDEYLTCLFACEWEEEPALLCDAAYAECRADCEPPVAAPPAPSPPPA
jgi:hypothetical protein